MPREQRLTSIDFKDTFLDAQHVRDSFPGQQVEFQVRLRPGACTTMLSSVIVQVPNALICIVPQDVTSGW